MLDWRELGQKRGLVVEGTTDKQVLELFLDKSPWGNWQEKLVIESAGKYDNVLKELNREGLGELLWGLIDRDWRENAEIIKLQEEYPRLQCLPRVMLENYFINPAELALMLPTVPVNFQYDIEQHLQGWVQHGALSMTLYEQGAYEFCRGAEGYPRALLDNAGISKSSISAILSRFQTRLDPQNILAIYQNKSDEFTQLGNLVYSYCINGKMFFREVIVPILNKIFSKQKQNAEKWLLDLANNIPACPADLIPILIPLVA